MGANEVPKDPQLPSAVDTGLWEVPEADCGIAETEPRPMFQLCDYISIVDPQHHI